EPGTPGRQRGDDGVAFHVVAGNPPDLLLRAADVVHHVADHDAKPILVKPTEFHPSFLPSNCRPLARKPAGICWQDDSNEAPACRPRVTDREWGETREPSSRAHPRLRCCSA